MKLLYFSTFLHHLLKEKTEEEVITGGAAVQWKSWAKGLIGNGHQFGLLTYKNVSETISESNGIDIVEAYNPNYGIKKIRIFYYRIPLLFKAIKSYNPDCLIQGGATTYTAILMIIAKILRIKFIHRIANDPDVDERIYKMVDKKIASVFKFGLRFADIISVQNSYQYKILSKRFPQKKIIKLVNPFEVGTKSDDILSRNQRFYYAWVGNFRYMKNMPQLLQVVKMLPNLEFKIAGTRHGDIDRSTEITIEKLKKCKNVEFVGYLDRAKIVPFFLKAIALVNTSHFEGFSNTFLEAWSCGTPVVSTKFANPDDIIQKFKLGKVADDFSNLPRLIEEISNLDDNNYKELSIKCFNYVKKYHDPQKLSAQFVEFLIKN